MDKSFVNKYTYNLITILKNFDEDVIDRIVKELDKCHNTDSKIYIIGNGGSAATSSHMANDLGIGLKIRDIKNFNVESLSDNTSICTAIANDIGFENIFYTQIKDKIKRKDVLIAISCSGNSQNIIKAVKYAKEKGTSIIGLTGFNGGELKKLSDINFHIETTKGEYGLVEDAHMILDHLLFSYYISLKNKEEKVNNSAK